jgi:hypothetical protein
MGERDVAGGLLFFSFFCASKQIPQLHNQIPSFSTLSQRQLNNTIKALRMFPNPLHNESDRLEQITELPLCPLSRRQTSHQRQIQRGRQPVRVLVGQHELVDQDLGRSGFHGGDDLLQDLAAGFVGVVVQDLVEEVAVRSWG